MSKNTASRYYTRNNTCINASSFRTTKSPSPFPPHSILQCIPPPKQKCIGSGRARAAPRVRERGEHRGSARCEKVRVVVRKKFAQRLEYPHQKKLRPDLIR